MPGLKLQPIEYTLLRVGKMCWVAGGMVRKLATTRSLSISSHVPPLQKLPIQQCHFEEINILFGLILAMPYMPGTTRHGLVEHIVRKSTS